MNQSLLKIAGLSLLFAINAVSFGMDKDSLIQRLNQKPLLLKNEPENISRLLLCPLEVRKMIYIDAVLRIRDQAKYSLTCTKLYRETRLINEEPQMFASRHQQFFYLAIDKMAADICKRISDGE